MTENDMTNEQEVRSQLDAVEKLDIAQLRKAAKMLGITSARDWGKEDFVRAIKTHQQANLASVVFDNSGAPAPGHARLLIHRNPTPKHKNSPVHVGVNGRLIAIPRGMEVDVPIPFLNALKRAITVVIVESGESQPGAPGGIFKDEPQTSYPFQVLAITPGPFVNPNDNRAVAYKKRKAFFDKFGNWPTDGELKEYMKDQMRRTTA